MTTEIERILRELRDVHHRASALPAGSGFGVKADLHTRRMELHAEARRIARAQTR